MVVSEWESFAADSWSQFDSKPSWRPQACQGLRWEGGCWYWALRYHSKGICITHLWIEIPIHMTLKYQVQPCAYAIWFSWCASNKSIMTEHFSPGLAEGLYFQPHHAVIFSWVRVFHCLDPRLIQVKIHNHCWRLKYFFYVEIHLVLM